MQTERPLVSVLISTFNRSPLLRRAIGSVLKQTFGDLEIVVIDDCSTDDTPAVVASISDPRIRYFRNTTNVGSKHGDRAHVRRFIYELMRGKYFVYLCDDDYWLPSDLLERQVRYLENDASLAFVFGNQLSHFLSSPESYFGGTPESPVTFTRETLAAYFDFATGRSKSPYLGFHPKLFPQEIMTSEEYLRHFSKNPPLFNRIVGATLYSRTHFIEAGAMRADQGSAWQAGYEFLMGPACMGGVAYIDEPAIVTEIRKENASFRRTQVEHYLDSVKSIDVAFLTPLANAQSPEKRRFLRGIKAETIRSLTRSFAQNTIVIRATGALDMCSAENMAAPVTYRQVAPVYWSSGVWPTLGDFIVLSRAELTPAADSPAGVLLQRLVRGARASVALLRGKNS